MGLGETARSTAQAKVSEAEAEVAQLQNDLKQAQLDLDQANATGDLLDSASSIPVVGALTEKARGDSGVDAAAAKAKVDNLTAQLSSAETKLSLTRKAQSAVESVTGGAEEAEEAVKDAVDG